MKPLNMTVFNGQKWVFQQDSAPAHKDKTTQEWLQRNILAFISAKEWPSGIPDLNPPRLYTVGCFGGHGLPKESQQPGQPEAAAEIPLEMVRAATEEWPEHFKSCVRAEGGHFERHYYK